MGNRLSKIATRTGDKGTTGLGDGSRTDKDSLRVHAMGDVDELNSQIGMLLCEELPDTLHEELMSIQHDLFDMGGELCIPGYTLITEVQCRSVAVEGLHFARRFARGGGGACMPHGVPACRAQHRQPGQIGDDQ